MWQKHSSQNRTTRSSAVLRKCGIFCIINYMELEGLPSTVMPLPAVTLTFDLISMSQAHDGSLPAVILTFDLWSQMLISTSTTQIHVWPTLGEIRFIGLWDMVFTRFLGHCLLWPWPLTPKSNQHIYEPKYICDQNWAKFTWLVFEIWCSQGFRETKTHTHWLTNRQTDPNTVCLRHRFSTVVDA